MKGGEGINEVTFMFNPWTQTMIWGLAWGGERMGLCGSGEMEKKWKKL